MQEGIIERAHVHHVSVKYGEKIAIFQNGSGPGRECIPLHPRKTERAKTKHCEEQPQLQAYQSALTDRPRVVTASQHKRLSSQ